MKLFLPLAMLALSTTAFAFNQSTDLKGITTVNVMVSEVPGVDTGVLAATLRDALRGAGLAVLEPGQASDTVPTISLHVSLIKEPNGRFFATDTVLACLDNVSNSRTAGQFSAVIWSRDVLQLLGMVDTRRILEAETKLIDLFLSDYRRGNLK